MWISLLIKEKGIGFLSGNCSSKLLKFMDFLSILGGVPVLSLPIENFKLSILFARAIEGLSPTLPAAKDFFPNLILPLKNVPVVRTALVQLKTLPSLRITFLILFFSITISSTEPSTRSRFSCFLLLAYFL